MHERAVYKYYIYADVNNMGRMCIFQTKQYFQAKRLLDKLQKDNDYFGCYTNPEMQRKLEAFEVHE